MVADLHALTTPYDREELRRNRREVVIDYLAAGLDPEKSVIFQQADSLHAELSFYLTLGCNHKSVNIACRGAAEIQNEVRVLLGNLSLTYLITF